VSKIRSIEKSNRKQRTLDQTVVEVVPLIVKSKDLFVTLEVSLEDKVSPKTYNHHSHYDIQMNETTKNTSIKSSDSRLHFD
jgi:hypothetical protein